MRLQIPAARSTVVQRADALRTREVLVAELFADSARATRLRSSAIETTLDGGPTSTVSDAPGWPKRGRADGSCEV